MNRIQILIFLILATVVTNSFSQSFEGKIFYRLSVESSDPKRISPEQIKMMFKDVDTLCVLYIKGDHYKFVTLDCETSNVTTVNHYDPISNKVYDYRPADPGQEQFVIETENSAVNRSYKIQKTKKDNITILGEECNAITMDYGYQSVKIYFSDKYKVNGKTIKNASPSFLQYIRECEAVPLKMIMSGNGAVHKLVFEARDIVKEPIDSIVFDVPKRTTR